MRFERLHRGFARALEAVTKELASLGTKIAVGGIGIVESIREGLDKPPIVDPTWVIIPVPICWFHIRSWRMCCHLKGFAAVCV